MKIRTINDLQDSIDKEMTWRKHELIAIKNNINTARKFAKETALRSGIALLYAHWEGSIKSIATYYLEYISRLSLPYAKLKSNFLAISIKSDLDQFEATNKSTLQTQIVNTVINLQAENSKIPFNGIIKTNSNLKSDVFIEIMATIGLDCSYYESSYNLIDEVLLKMRNEIAHGERLESISLDVDRYNRIHDKVYALISNFATQVMNAAMLKQFEISLV